ncbi:MAG: branched-chain amino acid aminotransferase [Firmicutes bacterium]|nr:branched-chain amino acid aminotransferase [Bacillota bacterium]
MLNITITKTSAPKEKPNPEVLGFGKFFSDHMFVSEYTSGKWVNPRIVPFAPFLIHPASTVLHYGAEVFEGLKAYRTKDGGIQLFRPQENAKRMNVSCERMCLPTVPEADFMQILTEFVRLEQDWVPSLPGTSLYLRPYLFGNDEFLGVHPVDSAVFMLIGSPVGAYYAGGLSPVRIMVECDDVRAVKGGTGYTKCGGNYAASLRAGKRAIGEKCAQVLWLDGVNRKYIEEVGAMNVMFKIAGEVVTPELSGSILPGITRSSCIELLRASGIKVTERPVSFDEIIAAHGAGTLEEAFGTGTAAVISPIGEFFHLGKSYTVNGRQIGKTTQELYDMLTGLQWGRELDKFGWTYKI